MCISAFARTYYRKNVEKEEKNVTIMSYFSLLFGLIFTFIKAALPLFVIGSGFIDQLHNGKNGIHLPALAHCFAVGLSCKIKLMNLV